MNEFILFISRKEKQVIHLYLEEINIKWDFYLANDMLTFVINKHCSVIPKAIYYRSCDFDFTTELGKKIQLLSEALEWTQNLIGQTKENNSNWSKPYQQISTLQQAIDNNKILSIKTPQSIIIKNKPIPSNLFKHSIIKSMSSTRSIVVDESTYEKWNKKNINSIPIMLQERIDGNYLRFHVFKNECWSIIAVNKEGIDYRYSCSKENLKEYAAPKELINFSIYLSKQENNTLIGVDFIENHGTFFCLESNPGPGWNWFYKE